MKNSIFAKLVISFLILGFASFGWAKVKVVKDSELPLNCASLGFFEGNAGYGKSMDGERIALYRALKRASNAGADHAIVKELNRGISDQGGYSLVEGFICPEENAT